MGLRKPEPKKVLSDEDMDVAPAASFLTDEDMDTPSEQKGLLSRMGTGAVEGLEKASKFAAKYTTNPMRVFWNEMIQDPTRSALANKHAYEQVGKDLPPDYPTYKQMFTKLGVSDKPASESFPGAYSETGEGLLKLKKGGLLDPSPAGAAGLGFEMTPLGDPSNVLPLGEIVGAGLKGGAKLGGKIAEPVIETISKGTKAAKSIATKGTAKVASALSGLPEKTIQTYIEKGDDIAKIYKKYGKDFSSAADDMRASWSKSIQETRGALNKQIENALETGGNKPMALSVKELKNGEKVADILAPFHEAKSKLNPKLNADKISEIDDLMSTVDSLIGGRKEITVLEANQLKNFLQEAAKGSYSKGGQIYTRGSEAANAAKQSAAITRKRLNEAAPEIAKANNQHAILHDLESKINKNLISPGKSDSALFSAGSGAGTRPRKQLEQIGNLTGRDVLGEAEKLSSAKEFGNAGLTTLDVTGKGVERTGKGAVAGGLLGSAVGAPVPGAIIGAALTSPLGIKTAIDVGQISMGVASKLIGAPIKSTEWAAKKIYEITQTPQGKTALDALMKAEKSQLGHDKGLLPNE